ncbi:hypothetical protein [Mangrovibacillus cuniculi]|uniref:YodN n=1 Tax=Mangrovibacillus cuniculi TaxID=2593652 RepID=A0A7S8HFN1_9BACI|nr:hypothetical protein [Mangrovibacillus cuniculi]QPC46610.1 hypothetical protein G8O30_06360 [Mangrovibacillus cuniculi]
MSKRKKPKFRVGEEVVIVIYGTVGFITEIKTIDGKYLYEINHSEGLFKEQVLIPVSEYEGSLVEREQIDIEYKFFFGDIVQVTGYGQDLFKVVGFRTEIWRYKEDAWEDVIYELTRMTDGDWLEADEEEITLIADAEQADVLTSKYGIQFPVQETKTPKKQVVFPVQRYAGKVAVDKLLDAYNDYRTLYKMFGDEKYEKMLRTILKQLKKLSSENEHA